MKIDFRNIGWEHDYRLAGSFDWPTTDATVRHMRRAEPDWDWHTVSEAAGWTIRAWREGDAPRWLVESVDGAVERISTA